MQHLDLAFEKLNELLDECFWAERRYYNAAEDVQQTEYKRFLGHESVNRNRYSNAIATAITQENREPSRLYIDKTNNRDWHQIKSALENPHEEELIDACIEQDKVVLAFVEECLNDGWLPVDILEILVPMEFQIKQSHIDLELLRRKLVQEDAPKKKDYDSNETIKKLRAI